ncbi:hypothetical protein [Runella sp.]
MYAAVRKNLRYFQNISEIWKSDADIFDITDTFIEKLQQTKELTNTVQMG